MSEDLHTRPRGELFPEGKAQSEEEGVLAVVDVAVGGPGPGARFQIADRGMYPCEAESEAAAAVERRGQAVPLATEAQPVQRSGGGEPEVASESRGVPVDRRLVVDGRGEGIPHSGAAGSEASFEISSGVLTRCG